MYTMLQLRNVVNLAVVVNRCVQKCRQDGHSLRITYLGIFKYSGAPCIWGCSPWQGKCYKCHVACSCVFTYAMHCAIGVIIALCVLP